MGLLRSWLEARAVVAAAEAMLGGDPCECGHPALAHTHYRRGTDCGACGTGQCSRYRKASA